MLLPSPDTQEMLIKHYVIATFALKVVDIGHLLISQMSADIFLLDWERPKPNLKGGGGDAQPSSVSVWRTYLIANEWNELQSIRKTSLTLQIISVVFILKVCGLEHLATGRIT